MTTRTYSSPEAFKQALEQRLRTSAKSGAEFARKRQLLVFDRFLARVVAVLGDAATLKGGLVLELRIERARTTNDVDLRMVGSPNDILARLQAAGRRDLGDFLMFEVGPDEDDAEIRNDGMQYDGLRFRAECKPRGRSTASPLALTSRSAVRSSAIPRSWWPRTSLLLPASHRRRCASTRSRRTFLRSYLRCISDTRAGRTPRAWHAEAKQSLGAGSGSIAPSAGGWRRRFAAANDEGRLRAAGA
jgi:hypothetical protein